MQNGRDARPGKNQLPSRGILRKSNARNPASHVSFQEHDPDFSRNPPAYGLSVKSGQWEGEMEDDLSAHPTFGKSSGMAAAALSQSLLSPVDISINFADALACMSRG